MILSRSHLASETKDYPCTYALNFRIRDNKLHMTVHMRSQDAIFGMGNDMPAFSFIHEMMWQFLKERYTELEYGNYFHFVDSFHIYERHFKMVEDILRDDEKFEEVFCPKISGADEVRFLIEYSHQDEKIPEEFKFSKWLKTYESKDAH